MIVIQSVDRVPISLVSFPSDIMVSLTTLAPWIQLKKISLGVPHLLMVTTIMYQVEAIMEIVDQNALVQHVVQINSNANQASANIPITVTVRVHVLNRAG